MIKMVGLFLLLLLKILGWICFILLLILITMLLLILFIPVRYDVLAQNERSMELLQSNNPLANLQLQLKASWLLHLIHISVHYGPDGIRNEIRVAGIDIQKVQKQLAKRKEEKQKQKKEKKNRRMQKKPANSYKANEVDIREGDLHQSQQKPENSEVLIQEKTEKKPEKNIENTKDSIQKDSIQKDSIQKDSIQIKSENNEVLTQRTPEDKEDLTQQKKPEDHEDSKQQKKLKNSKDLSQQQKKQKANWNTGQSSEKAKKQGSGRLSKIRSQIQRIHQEFTDESNRHAVSHLWKELLKILRSYKPRKMKANLAFSLANPALTGEVTGIISLMPLIYRYPCSITPDFISEKLYIEGEIQARGKVTVSVFLLSSLRLLRDKEFKKVVRRIMKR